MNHNLLPNQGLKNIPRIYVLKTSMVVFKSFAINFIFSATRNILNAHASTLEISRWVSGTLLKIVLLRSKKCVTKVYINTFTSNIIVILAFICQQLALNRQTLPLPQLYRKYGFAWMSINRGSTVTCLSLMKRGVWTDFTTLLFRVNDNTVKL
ncbi:hypothetical protein FF38_12901 [Lucilia cuprina]|uniref:Uncharacterized protein n=1 Tax=Lucilia cuprina TaxID=7375 RepID=A0A0L0CPM1_LUCCU|nr:hypothetical protein FF38_12901 [Lucilia cuprina]